MKSAVIFGFGMTVAFAFAALAFASLGLMLFLVFKGGWYVVGGVVVGLLGCATNLSIMAAVLSFVWKS